MRYYVDPHSPAHNDFKIMFIFSYTPIRLASSPRRLPGASQPHPRRALYRAVPVRQAGPSRRDGRDRVAGCQSRVEWTAFRDDEVCGQDTIMCVVDVRKTNFSYKIQKN